MASKTLHFLALNLLLFFSLVSSTYVPCPPPHHNPKPTPKPSPSPPSCPRDTLKFAACMDLLGVISITIGKPPKQPCCSLSNGLSDFEAAACLCTAIKTSPLGIQLRLNVDVTLLLNYCGKKLPSGFLCA